MQYLLGVLVILAIGFAVARGCQQQNGGKPEAAAAPPAVGAAAQASPHRAEVQQQLQRLARGEPPKDLSRVVAMCYKMTAPPNRAEYVCPKCGEKTLYTEGTAVFVERDLQACRQLVRQVPTLDAQLDESDFCRKCKPQVTVPELGLILRYPGEDRPQRASGITPTDLQMLTEFLRGSDRHKGRFGEETPLRDYTGRLAELLGVEVTEGAR